MDRSAQLPEALIDEVLGTLKDAGTLTKKRELANTLIRLSEPWLESVVRGSLRGDRFYQALDRTCGLMSFVQEKIWRRVQRSSIASHFENVYHFQAVALLMVGQVLIDQVRPLKRPKRDLDRLVSLTGIELSQDTPVPEKVLRREALDAFWSRLRDLPAQQALALHFHFIEGWSTRRIAESLKIDRRKVSTWIAEVRCRP